MNKITSLANITNAIVECEALWEDKYDAIFSQGGLVYSASEAGLSYYDPDSSYEEDVRAFHTAIMEEAEDETTIEIAWRELLDRFSDKIAEAGWFEYSVAEGMADYSDTVEANWKEAQTLGMTKHEFDARRKG